jgi:hypothetical protein
VAVVGSTTLKPGQSTVLYTEFTMHAGMDGPHLFELVVKTNDPQQREKKLYVASNWVPPGTN